MPDSSTPVNLLTYAEFWPFYLKQHSKPATIRIHAFATLAALTFVGFAVLTAQYIILPLALVIGYGPAWYSHFFIQKNRPATFKYPVWSLISDFRLMFYFLSGRLPEELKKFGIS